MSLQEGVYSAAELLEAGIAEDMEWAEKVYIDDGFLVLNIEYPYEIELDRIDTTAKLLEWMVHLLEKEWVTRDVLWYMVRECKRHFKYQIYFGV